MAWTSSDLTAIRTARKRGIRTVQYGDRSTTYQSDQEMRQVEQDILRELNRIAQRPRQFTIAASKGLD